MPNTLAETIQRTINDHLKDKPVLVWNDSGGTLAEAIPQAVPEGVHLLPFEGSYLQMRAAIERADPAFRQKWMVYIPEAAPDPSWLRDYELFGARLDWTLETLLTEKMGLRSTAETRQLLAGPRGRALAAAWDDVMPRARPPLTLAQLQQGLLAVAFGLETTYSVGRAVLEYVTDPDLYGQQLTRLGLHGTFAQAIRTELGLNIPSDREPVAADRLAAALLFSELADRSGGLGADAFHALLPAVAHRREWVKLADEWREHSRLREGFIRWSKELEQRYEVKSKLAGFDQLLPVQSFVSVDAVLLQEVCARLEASGVGSLAEHRDAVTRVAEARKSTVWRDTPDGVPWEALGAAACLVRDCGAARDTLSAHATLEPLIAHFTADDGWWRLDAAYRILAEASGDLGPRLCPLFFEPATAAYGEWLRELGVKFAAAVERAGAWQVASALPQATFWNQTVADSSETTAVLLVDALRYDIGQRLKELLEEQGYAVEQRPMLTVLPSVTEVGMAALLPTGDGEPVVTVAEGKLNVSAKDGTPLSIKSNRLAWLKENLAAGVCHFELDDLARATPESLQTTIGDARWVIVTGREIDRAGRFLDDVTLGVLEALIKQVAAGIKNLHQAGVRRVVTVTDHGFLYFPQDLEVEKVPAPTASPDLARHRRYLVGHPPQRPDLLRFSLAAMGLGGQNDVAVPRGLTCLGIPGPPSNFTHGGLTLQEAVVAALVSTADVTAARVERVQVQVTFPPSITSQVVLVTLAPVGEPTLFHAPRKLQLQAREAGAILAVSDVVEVHAAPVRARLVVRQLPAAGLELAVVDVETQEQIARQTVPVELRGYDDLL